MSLATSTGQLEILTISEEGKMQQTDKVTVADPSILCLSIDANRDQSSLSISLSDGNVCIRSGVNLASSTMFKAHDLETWTASFDTMQIDILYTGADDCTCKIWDLRSNFSQPMTTLSRFDGGVTSVTCHPSDENILSIGSYDECLRIVDKRNVKRPLNTVRTGGGIWRIKWHPSGANTALMACMHGGCKILTFNPSDYTVTSDTAYQEHRSIAYGADWSSDGKLIATCSFYDHAAHLWRP